MPKIFVCLLMNAASCGFGLDLLLVLVFRLDSFVWLFYFLGVFTCLMSLRLSSR
jgi:hypothetical protein